MSLTDTPQFMAILEMIPESLRQQVIGVTSTLTEEIENLGAERSKPILTDLGRVIACSDFVSQSLTRHQGLLTQLVDSELLSGYSLEGGISSLLKQCLDGCTNETELSRRLRQFRRYQMARLTWLDICGKIDLAGVVATLSELADAVICQGMDYLNGWQKEQFGTPYCSSGEEAEMVVLGMGKLGAGELNFSSDIDLIFTYPEEGETIGGRRQLSNHEFFVRLGQRLIQLIHQTTADGFVFRVDMRLRPFGESSPLAVSFDAMESYYQSHGREWERYALIKARPITGRSATQNELMARLRPFIYRRYLDFCAFESIREMKLMISAEVNRRSQQINVKLGAGGIREIEFIGQAFQLIRGGREKALQIRPILSVLEFLRGAEILPDWVVTQLTTDYQLLRTVEHRLQQVADQQTHLLPSESREQERIAFSLNESDWPAASQRIVSAMQRVHQHFEQVFVAPQSEGDQEGSLPWEKIWNRNMDDESALELLEQSGLNEAKEVLTQLYDFHDSRVVAQMSTHALQRLTQLMPLLLGALKEYSQPAKILRRLILLIEQVSRRSAYMVLLVENPLALSQLIRLFDASPWIASEVARAPQLLDELLDPRLLYAPPEPEELHNTLHHRLSLIDADDQEDQMNELRRFKLSNLLRIAATDIMDVVPLMVVSDYLSAVAEVILDAALDMAWNQMSARYGLPEGVKVKGEGFAIIGYGKLGGIELGYGSDLDLVFFHTADEGGVTDGERSIDNATFFARLGQRLIHLLTTRTGLGQLYEIDSRLRPSGTSGQLVSTLNAFKTYQENQAWTWEHQALVRARVVAGDKKLGQRFNEIRSQILQNSRNLETLAVEVKEMREKMRESLDKGDSDHFDLKQGHGGIADIEFMVQYGVLGWAHQFPQLTQHSDNIRQLQALAEAGLWKREDAEMMADHYRLYRSRSHHQTLLESSVLIDKQEYSQERQEVQTLWDRAFLG